MATRLALPKLGVEMESARLDQWVVAEGDSVAEGDIVANLETEKVMYELPSPASGRIHLIAEEGEDFQIGAELAAIAASDQEYEALLADSGPVAAPDDRDGDEEPRPRPDGASADGTPATVPAASGDHGGEDPRGRRDRSAARRRGEPLASPLARRIAAAEELDLADVEGSGMRGMIRRRDVESAIAARIETIPSESEAPVAESTRSSALAPPNGSGTTIKLSSMRRTIARRMHASMQESAQMTDFRELDVSAVIAMRDEAVARDEALGFRLSYTTILAKAASMALRAAPTMNSTLISETELQLHQTVGLGVAIAIDDGLVVPVVRGADTLSMRELNAELNTLIERSRTRKLSGEELSGGTFTLTNFGVFGSHMGTPILMQGQVGILGLGAILDRPVVRGGRIEPAKVMTSCLTVDHRVIDGETIALYQNELERLIAEPDLLLFG